MDIISSLISHHYWLFHALFNLGLGLVFYFAAGQITKFLVRKSQQTRFIYDEALFSAIKSPLSLLILGLTLLSLGFGILQQFNNSNAFAYLQLGRKFLFISAVCWVCVRFIHRFEDLYIQRAAKNSEEVDKTLVHALTQLVTISSIIITLLAVMQLFGLPISGLLTFGGIGGAAIAFASKDLLANLFGGLVVYLDRPFKIGDWIRSPDKQIEGIVERIGWRVTCIRTFDKRPLYVPNGVFLSISVENASRMLNRRIKTFIGIRYQDADKIDAITKGVKEMLLNHPEIDKNQTLIVNFTDFGPSSLNFMVYTFTKTTNWIKFQAVQHDVFVKIIQIITQNGAQCAFPTQTLYVQNDQAMAALAGHQAASAAEASS